MTARLITVAGPPSAGKTAVVRQIIKNLLPESKVAYLKIDVVQAWEDEELAKEFNIPVKKVYSGDMCPDHTGILVLQDAVNWANSENADYLIYESAGLCLRCTPYTENAFGLCVVPAVSGMHTPLKMAPMITFADAVVVTKIDLVSQAEKEVFREAVRTVSPDTDIIETDAISGTNMRYLMKRIKELPAPAGGTDTLRGVPPLGVCTICVGKKEVGWQNHFGVIRPLDAPDNLFRGD
ncbi:Urease accessory protein UreG [Methanimicrococcus hongohii]|uniref:Urease accessory protein UreG n=1 Tax=Methanimicrococcus hongohii TaxID=3028295 RepID=A0AA96V1P8_9EURY|nr:GTP-binding protein [Methanimicrococcus sp. Hf6]WNY23433.1 Urease accessory protein UreG [Methanimicrococcus sp. Hf6]